jgi:hypothetical protein
MNTISRYEAAEKIREIINADDYHAAKIWTKEDSVRLYLKFDTQAKKGWIDNGFINFAKDGSIENHADRCASVATDAIRTVTDQFTILPVGASTPVQEIEDENDFVPARDVAGDERGY